MGVLFSGIILISHGAYAMQNNNLSADQIAVRDDFDIVKKAMAVEADIAIAIAESEKRIEAIKQKQQEVSKKEDTDKRFAQEDTNNRTSLFLRPLSKLSHKK